MPPSDEYDTETCLAYQVLEHPERWLSHPSTLFLKSFLSGAEVRRLLAQPDFPASRIHGVLADPQFFQRFVDATGHPTLTITYEYALQFTHFSLSDGFAKLRFEAIEWHRTQKLRGVDDTPVDVGDGVVDHFWENLPKRTGMYTGDNDGWSLYCFLSGMTHGGDWLGMPQVPHVDRVFHEIKSRSEKHYGSPFAAFRIYDGKSLVAWATMPQAS